MVTLSLPLSCWTSRASWNPNYGSQKWYLLTICLFVRNIISSLGLSNNDIWEPQESPPESNQDARKGNWFMKKFGFTPENSKIGDALAKMEKDKLPNFLFREALIFGTVFQVWSKMAWNEKSRRYMFRETIFSNLDNLKYISQTL